MVVVFCLFMGFQQSLKCRKSPASSFNVPFDVLNLILGKGVLHSVDAHLHQCDGVKKKKKSVSHYNEKLSQNNDLVSQNIQLVSQNHEKLLENRH